MRKSDIKFNNGQSDNKTLIARVGLCAIAIVFLVVGILNGEALFILSKGVSVCLECIGIG